MVYSILYAKEGASGDLSPHMDDDHSALVHMCSGHLYGTHTLFRPGNAASPPPRADPPGRSATSHEPKGRRGPNLAFPESSEPARGSRAHIGKRDAPCRGIPFEGTLGLESLLGDGGELVEGLDVLISHLSEDLAVELDAGELQAVHELGVGLATYSKRGPPRGPPCAPAPRKRESRPPVSGALLSHGLTPQYHRRGAA